MTYSSVAKNKVNVAYCSTCVVGWAVVKKQADVAVLLLELVVRVPQPYHKDSVASSMLCGLTHTRLSAVLAVIPLRRFTRCAAHLERRVVA